MIIKNDSEFLLFMADINEWGESRFEEGYNWEPLWKKMQKNGLVETWSDYSGNFSSASAAALKNKDPLVAFTLLFRLFDNTYFYVNPQNGLRSWDSSSASMQSSLIESISNSSSDNEDENFKFEFNGNEMDLSEYEIPSFLKAIKDSIKKISTIDGIDEETIKLLDQNLLAAEAEYENGKLDKFKNGINRILRFLEKVKIPLEFTAAIITIATALS